MTGGEAIIALAAGMFVFAVSWGAVSIMAEPVTRNLTRTRPDLRAVMVLLLATTPFLFGAFGLVGVILFPHASPLDLAPVHRHDSLAGWSTHRAFTGSGVIAWVTLITASLLMLRLVQVTTESILAMRRIRRLLERSATRTASGRWNVPYAEPIALAVGLFRPSIFISNAVAEHLGPDGCEIVEAHERAHLARGDLWARFAMTVVCGLYPDRVVATLQQALILAQEQACDAAISNSHSRLEIAETLVRMERSRGVRSHLCAGFQDADIALRVRALLEPDFEPLNRSMMRTSAISAVLIAAVFVALEPLHHKIEALFLMLGG